MFGFARYFRHDSLRKQLDEMNDKIDFTNKILVNLTIKIELQNRMNANLKKQNKLLRELMGLTRSSNEKAQTTHDQAHKPN